jgi:hypothetical protein
VASKLFAAASNTVVKETSAYIKGFTPENIAAFFDIFEKEMEKIKFSPNRLFNIDETGITVVQHKPSGVVALKGKKLPLCRQQRLWLHVWEPRVFSCHLFWSCQERT